MGCNNYEDIGLNMNHCGRYSPYNGGNFNDQGAFNSTSWQGVPVSHAKYVVDPRLQERQDNIDNILDVPTWDDDMVMYPSQVCTESANPRFSGGSSCSVQECGNFAKPIPGGFFGTQYVILGHYPSELSFRPIFSDQWFYYLFDLSDPIVGYPCYFLETITRTSSSSTTTSSPGSGTEGQPGYTPPSSSTSTSSSSGTEQRCHPCTTLNCSAGSSEITYTTQDGRVVDGRDPFPTIWTAGTRSNSIAFRYVGGLPSANPISAVDFNIIGNGLAETDAWDKDLGAGLNLTVTDNPWADPGDIGFESIYVTGSDELNIGTEKTGLQLKFRYSPSTTTTANTETITGSIIRLDEIISPGVGYEVGDTFNISITANSLTIDFTVKITEVGEIESSNPYTNYDLINAGDTVNGHTVESVRHMDLNFNWHVVNIDGAGSDFAYDQTYTTNRGNQIVVKAGNGIADKAFIGGLYEFRNKSFQYMTADYNVQPNAADDYIQPTARKDVEVTFTDGSNQVTLVNGSDSTYLRVGYSVDSPNIPNNTYITAVNGNTATLSQSAAATSTSSSYNGKLRITLIEIVNGQILSIRVANGGQNWQLLQRPPLLVLVSSSEPATSAAEIDYQFTGGVLQSVNVKSRGAGYAQGVAIDIAIPQTMKTRDNVAWPSSERGADPANELGDAVYGLKEFQNSSNEGKTIEIDTATEFNRKPIDYNYEGGAIDTYEKFQKILQRAANDRPKSKGDSVGLESLRFKTSLRPKDIRSALNKSQYEEVRFDNPTNEVKDLKRTKGVLRTERLERALPDREDLEDLQWKTLDSRLPDAFIDAPGGARKFMEQLVVNDEIRKNEILDLNSEAPEVSASGIKLATYDREEVRTVRGTAFDLPCASTYTKYMLRQFKPDSRNKSAIYITLNWEPTASTSCADNTGCAINYPFVGTDAGSTTTTSGDSSTTTSVTYASVITGPFGEGCRQFSAEGQVDVYNDLTNGAYIYELAVNAYGNPFAFKCQ